MMESSWSAWRVLTVLLLWMFFVWYGFLRHGSAVMYDFLPTFAAGRIIADPDLSADLYLRDGEQFNTVTAGPIFEVSRQIDPRPSTPFVYPPLYAWLMKPVTRLDYDSAKLLLLVVNAAAFAVGIVSLLLVGARQQGVWWTLAAVAVFGIWFQPIGYSSWLGQITALVFGLVCVSLFCAKQGRQWCAGVFLGGALAVKLFPLGVLFFLAASRRLQAVAAAIVTWATVLVLSAILSGPSLVGDYIATVRGIAEAGSLAVWNNQSLTAFLLRFSASWDSILRWTFLEVPAWIWVLALVTVLSFSVWSLRVLHGYLGASRLGDALAKDGASRWDEVGLVYSQGILLSLILTPVVWNHYEVLAIVPVFWIANRLHCEQDRLDPKVWVALLASAWLLMAMSTSWIAYALSDGRPRHDAAGLLALPVSLNLFGVILLFVLLNRLARVLRPFASTPQPTDPATRSV